jgi:hypothetical protein
LYVTGDDYLPVVPKWFVSDPGVIKEVSKKGLGINFLFFLKSVFKKVLHFVSESVKFES